MNGRLSNGSVTAPYPWPCYLVKNAPGGFVRGHNQRRNTMAWNTPKIAEIAVGLEINSYACAE